MTGMRPRIVRPGALQHRKVLRSIRKPDLFILIGPHLPPCQSYQGQLSTAVIRGKLPRQVVGDIQKLIGDINGSGVRLECTLSDNQLDKFVHD